jgi:hypothetical protein
MRFALRPSSLAALAAATAATAGFAIGVAPAAAQAAPVEGGSVQFSSANVKYFARVIKRGNTYSASRNGRLVITGGNLSRNGTGVVNTTQGGLGIFQRDRAEGGSSQVTFRSVRLTLTRTGGTMTAIPNVAGERRATLASLQPVGRLDQHGGKVRIVVNPAGARKLNSFGFDLNYTPGMNLGTLSINAR